jgi:hypothetical protein
VDEFSKVGVGSVAALAVFATAVAVAPSGSAAAGADRSAGVVGGRHDAFTDAAPPGRHALAPTADRPAFVLPAGAANATVTLTPLGVAPRSSDRLRAVDDDPATAVPGAIARDAVVQDDPWQGTDLHYLSTDVRAQLLFELEDASAPTAFDLAVSLPPGARLVANDALGAIFVVDRHDDVIGVFARPWAVDADGMAVPTSFEIVGTTLRQHVDHRGAAYPVIADPQYTWGWVTGTAYYSRRETKNMTSLTYGATVVAGLCAAFGAETLGVACAISAAFYAQWAFQADRAFSDGRCLKIKVPTSEAGSYPFGQRVCTDKVS